MVEWVAALRSTGSVAWYRGVAAAQAALALTDGTEVAVQSTPDVAPGQVGWFIARCRAPASPGTHSVALFPRIDGRGELPDLGIYTQVTVRQRAALPASLWRRAQVAVPFDIRNEPAPTATRAFLGGCGDDQEVHLGLAPDRVTVLQPAWQEHESTDLHVEGLRAAPEGERRSACRRPRLRWRACGPVALPRGASCTR